MHYSPRLFGLLPAVALLAWSADVTGADHQHRSSGCLYAVYVGADKAKVEPCTPGDPMNLANDKKVRAVIRAFGLDAVAIRFNGCKTARYSAAPDEGPRRYVITYPSVGGESHIAPITHELAHVLQMEIAGSLQALQRSPSRKVELGADYLTGIVFIQHLSDIGYNEFQHNLSLIGQYVEMDATAHGTPAQRTAAFRFGANLKFEEVDRNIRRAYEEFLSDSYGHIVQNK